MRTGLILFVFAVAAKTTRSPGQSDSVHASIGAVATTTRVAVPPVLDGRLNEAEWRSAPSIVGEESSRSGASAAGGRTEVRFLVDDKALYVGAWLFGSDQATLRSGGAGPDRLGWGDSFLLVLGTHRGPDRLAFGTTPIGTRYDARILPPHPAVPSNRPWQSRAYAAVAERLVPDWDGEWEVRVSADSAAWYAEFRIPFESLDYGASRLQRWEIGFVRRDAATGVQTSWPKRELDPDPPELSSGQLTVAPVARGIAASVAAYGLGSVRRQRSGLIGTTRAQEFGFESRFAPLPTVAAEFAVNPDFTDVESDEQRINLTRFPLLVPERRGWFGDIGRGLEIGVPGEVQLFYPRRIGFDSLGRAAPVSGSGRLSTLLGGVEIEAIHIRTEQNRNQREQAYSLARAVKRLGPLWFGGLAIQRQSTTLAADRNRTFAVDGGLELGRGWSLAGWTAKTESPQFRGGDNAFGAGLRQDRPGSRVLLQFTQVGEFFNPEVGFLTRRAVRIFEAESQLRVRVGDSWLAAVEPTIRYRGHYGLEGFNQSTALSVETGLRLKTGLLVASSAAFRQEGLLAPFLISTGVNLPPGRYRWLEAGLSAASDPRAPFSVTGRLEVGGLYHGTQLGGAVVISYRPGGWIGTSVLVDYTEVSLSQGAFSRSLVGWRLELTPVRWISLESLIQYNNTNRLWLGNARLRWLAWAGTSVSLVYDEAHEADRPWHWVRPQTRSVVLKAATRVRLLQR